jgi:hypothetical protein
MRKGPPSREEGLTATLDFGGAGFGDPATPPKRTSHANATRAVIFNTDAKLRLGDRISGSVGMGIVAEVPGDAPRRTRE